MNWRGKIWKIGWRLAVCAVLLAWIFHVIFIQEGREAWERDGLSWTELSRIEQWKIGWTHGPAELWQTLRLVSPWAFIASLGFVALTILLGVVRWRMVLKVQGLDLSPGRATGISFVAHFFNSFLLGSTGGDLMKAYYAARETHHKKTEAVVTVFADRLLGLWAMLFFAALMMLPNWELMTANKRFAACAMFILLMLGGCSVFLFIAFWSGVSRKFPRARHWLRKLPKGDLLERSVDSSRQFGQHRLFLLKSVLISMAINTAVVFQVMVLAKGLQIDIPPVALFAIVPTVISISALPITPSGLGVRENLFVLILAAAPIYASATSALSLSLLTFAGGLFWSIVGGAVYIGLKRRQHLDEVREPDAVGETS